MKETLSEFCRRKGLPEPYDPGIEPGEFYERWNTVFEAQFNDAQERLGAVIGEDKRGTDEA